MSLFRPSEKLNRFTDLDINLLKDRGFKAVFIDVDNTITAPNVGKLTEEAKKFIDDVKNSGIIPIIFSNNTKSRVKSFIGDYNVEWHYLVLKPFPFAIWSVCRKHKLKPSECVVLGDQLLTDILGANLSGCYGVYSKQLQEKDTPLTKINRCIEKIIWRHVLHEEM